MSPYSTVIDTVNRMCLLERQRKAAHGGKCLAAGYTVETGYQLRCTTHFTEFSAALAFLIEHAGDEQCPRLLGANHDDESSGLTDDEWALVWAAYESRAPKARRA